MREIRTSGSMSGEGKRDDWRTPQVTAPLLDSTPTNSSRRPCRLLEQLADIARQDRLAVLAQRAQLLDEVGDRRALADLLRIVGGEDDARRRDLDQRTL